MRQNFLFVFIQTETGSNCFEKYLALEQRTVCPIALKQVAEMPVVHRSAEERMTTLFIFKLIILEDLLEAVGIPFLRQTRD